MNKKKLLLSDMSAYVNVIVEIIMTQLRILTPKISSFD